jgi:uncharacterized OB-fold protein
LQVKTFKYLELVRFFFMRCPKCGFISFDHLENCLKCKKNIKAASEQLNGTVYNVAAPSFLKFDEEVMEAELDDGMVTVDAEETDDQYVDDALEVLVKEQQGENFALGDQDEEPDLAFDDEEEEEDREIEIDLSQFEDSTAEAEAEAEEQMPAAEEPEKPPEIPVPEELGDLSDLAPPTKETESAETKEKESAELDLGDLDFDLALGDLEMPEEKSGAIDQTPAVALDDIDFSDTLDVKKEEGAGAERKKAEEDDLDFELDLGGLTLKNDKEG